tara:strand:- start:3459 stop:3635 length:177 start_codon:yes stop_codon:yes gene_type:complete
MTGTPIPPLSITGGASAPAVAEGGNFGNVIQTKTIDFGLFEFLSVIAIAGALVWINRK